MRFLRRCRLRCARDDIVGSPNPRLDNGATGACPDLSLCPWPFSLAALALRLRKSGKCDADLLLDKGMP